MTFTEEDYPRQVWSVRWRMVIARAERGFWSEPRKRYQKSLALELLFWSRMERTKFACGRVEANRFTSKGLLRIGGDGGSELIFGAHPCCEAHKQQGRRSY